MSDLAVDSVDPRLIKAYPFRLWVPKPDWVTKWIKMPVEEGESLIFTLLSKTKSDSANGTGIFEHPMVSAAIFTPEHPTEQNPNPDYPNNIGVPADVPRRYAQKGVVHSITGVHWINCGPAGFDCLILEQTKLQPQPLINAVG